MSDTTVRHADNATDLPRDLVELSRRLRALGISSSMPNAGPNDPLPERLELSGEPLSSIIVESRRS